MQTNHRTFIIISLLIAMLVITGCNADASAGLFRQISESTTPVGIQYKQLLGLDATNTILYYSTTKGIFQSPNNSLKGSVKDKIIQSTYYDSASTDIAYLTNEDSVNINIFDVATPDSVTAIRPTDAALDASKPHRIVNLYPNGLVMLQGTSASDATKPLYTLGQYASGAVSSIITFPEMDGYSLVSVIQESGFEQSMLSTTSPVIISFVDNATKKIYRHVYYDRTTRQELPSLFSSKRIAGFSIDSSSKVYIITTLGELYGGTATGAFVEMYDSAKTYDVHGFMYMAEGTTNSHIITKSSSKNDALFVYSFPKGSTSANVTTTNSIRSGYGEYLFSAEIVSTLYVGNSSGIDTLLIATNENGLFKFGIKVDFANQDNSNNGRSSRSEEYQDFTPYTTL